MFQSHSPRDTDINCGIGISARHIGFAIPKDARVYSTTYPFQTQENKISATQTSMSKGIPSAIVRRVP